MKRKIGTAIWPSLVIWLALLNTAGAQLRETDIAELRQRLAQPVAVDFVEVPLTQVSQWLSRQLGMPCLIDQTALDELGLLDDETVSLLAEGIPLRTAFELLLEQHELAWFAKPGAVVITSQDEAATRMVVRAYAVGDLISIPASEDLDYDSVIDLIISTVASDTWAENGGGEADVRPLWDSKTIVVSQTLPIQLDIEDLLARIRELRRLQGLSTIEDTSATSAPGASAPKRYLVPAATPPQVYDNAE